jgi:hypothetical protein
VISLGLVFGLALLSMGAARYVIGHRSTITEKETRVRSSVEVIGTGLAPVLATENIFISDKRPDPYASCLGPIGLKLEVGQFGYSGFKTEDGSSSGVWEDNGRFLTSDLLPDRDRSYGRRKLDRAFSEGIHRRSFSRVGFNHRKDEGLIDRGLFLEFESLNRNPSTLVQSSGVSGKLISLSRFVDGIS